MTGDAVRLPHSDILMRSYAILALVLLLFVESAFAATISFDGLIGPNGAPFTATLEDGFSVTSTQGQWNIGQLSGNPTPSIFSRSDTAQIELVGPLFKFLAMETNDELLPFGTSSASYQVEGFLDNVSVLFGVGTISPQYETNHSPDSSQVLDRLVITVSRGQTSGYNVDNIMLEIVPEPSSLIMLGIGILSFYGRNKTLTRF